MTNSYAAAGVDTAAGDRAVELMKASVAATHGLEIVGGVGGFAGLFDASALLGYRRPLLASSTDGVGTKVAIAQALDIHDTIGQDLVAMVVDDIVVVGAKPLVMTDYIACGKLHPERIADIVRGIAEACAATGTALVGGETAEHPGLLGPDDYDVAGAAGPTACATATSSLPWRRADCTATASRSCDTSWPNAASGTTMSCSSSGASWAKRSSPPPRSTRRRCSSCWVSIPEPCTPSAT